MYEWLAVDTVLDDPRALGDDELRSVLRDLAGVRARLDGFEAQVVAEFEARACMVVDGALSAASWLAHHTKIGRTVAGSRVLLAKRLRRMPLTAQAMVERRITACHARSMARCLTPRTTEAFERDEAMLVGHAVGLEAADFDVVVTRWLFLNDPDGPTPRAEDRSELHASRHLGGRVRVDGDLNLEDGAEVLAELDWIRDLLWHEDRAAVADDPDKDRTHSQRLAAAMVEMARRSSMTHDDDSDDTDELDEPNDEADEPDPDANLDEFDEPDAPIEPDEPDDAGDDDPHGSADVERAAGEAPVTAPDPRSARSPRRDRDARRQHKQRRRRRRPPRPYLLVVTRIEALAGDRRFAAELDDGTPIPNETLRRWACDSVFSRILMRARGIPIDVGMATYGVSAAQRRALTARDRGCIVPGCRRKPAQCQAHHVVEFPDGPTDMANLVLLCHRHHKLVHRRVLQLIWYDHDSRWHAHRRDGTPVSPPPHLLVA